MVELIESIFWHLLIGPFVIMAVFAAIAIVLIGVIIVLIIVIIKILQSRKE